MGKNEAGSPSKSAKASSHVQEQPAIHPYPDWAAMQAYYGPGVAMTPPFFGTAVASGHAPHPYMWRPQPLMTPFGTPYAAIYPTGVYSHPSMPLGSHAHCQGIGPSTTSEAVMVCAWDLWVKCIEYCVTFEFLVFTSNVLLVTVVISLGLVSLLIVSIFMKIVTRPIETFAKSSSNKDRGLFKKLKGSDGVAVSILNGNANNAAGDATDDLSQSEDSSGEGSTDGSDGDNELKESKMQRKCSEMQRKCSGDIQCSGKGGKAEKLANVTRGGEKNAPSVCLGITIPPADATEKSSGSIPSSSPTPGKDLRVSTAGEVKTGVAPVTPPANAVVRSHGGVPPEVWIQDERELKRERRKQSNRESARRSRLRKQAETEELALKVETLTAENTTLRSEINRLIENSEKLRQENTALMEKLQKAQFDQIEEMPSEGNESEGITSRGTKNLLSKINKSSSANSSSGQQENFNKLRQLLDSNPRTDTIAAG